MVFPSLLFLTDGGMRVGRDYQAQIPPMTPLAGCILSFIYWSTNSDFFYHSERKPDQYAERALLVWSPTNEILDAKCKLLEKLTLFFRFDNILGFFY